MSTLLMVAVVVVLAALIAVPLFSIVEDARSPAPTTNVNVSATGTNTTVVHDGGDTLYLDELTLVVETTAEEVRIPLDDPDSTSGVVDSTTPTENEFLVQDRVEIEMQNDVERSVLVHRESGVVLGTLDD